MIKGISRVLITQNQLQNFSGSELVTLELAEHFSTNNVQVTILTNHFADPIKTEFEKNPKVKIILTNTKEAEQLKISNYDIIWIHHLTLTTKLIEEIAVKPRKKPFVIYHHMSFIEPLEFPIMFNYEAFTADLVLFNSEETKINLINKGVDFGEKAYVLGNPAPDEFYINSKVEKDIGKLRKIAVISNHPPEEIHDTVQMMRLNNITVDMFGRMKGGKIARVDSKLIKNYDLIISIGKTVQYCILNNTPVYCYDLFGGPGYLNDQNYALAKSNNFSGRGFNRKKAPEIFAEITSYYAKGVASHSYMHKKHSNELKLSNRLNEAFKHRSAASATNHKFKLMKIDIQSYINYAQQISNLLTRHLPNAIKYKELKTSYIKRKNDLEYFKQIANRLTKENASLRLEVERLRSSAYWKMKNKARRIMHKSKDNT